MTERLKYRGDCRDYDPNRVLGPDTGKRILKIKSMTYDPITDTSTAVLRAVLPADFSDAVGPTIGNQMERDRIGSYFRA